MNQVHDGGSEPAPFSVGAHLRALRENAQLSVDDVAHQLKLARRQVLAIENDELDALPGPTFVRGFIRNYARLLRVDATALLEAGNLIAPASAPMEHLAPTMGELPHNVAPTSSWSRWLIPIGLVLLLGAGIAFYDFGGVSTMVGKKMRKDAGEAIVAMPGATGSAPSDKSPPAAIAPSETVAPATPPTTAAGPQPVSPAATTPTALPSGTAAAAGDRPPAAASANTGKVDLQLDSPAWVEIRDGRGELLVSRTLPAAAHSFTGAMPMSLRLGNARFVKLQFNGAAVDLAPFTNREIARLTLPQAGR